MPKSTVIITNQIMFSVTCDRQTSRSQGMKGFPGRFSLGRRGWRAFYPAGLGEGIMEYSGRRNFKTNDQEGALRPRAARSLLFLDVDVGTVLTY